MVQKKFWVQKNFGSRKSFCQKNWVPKKFWIKKEFGQKKNLSKKNSVQKFWIQNIFGSKKFGVGVKTVGTSSLDYGKPTSDLQKDLNSSGRTN